MWNTQKYFPGIKTINRGFGGSQIADSIYYADRIILPYKPKTIVFYAGDNDLASGKTPEQAAEDFKTLTQLIHEQLPKTRILFVAIKPSIARWKLIDSVRKANALIEAYTKTDDRLFYVDVDTLMTGPSGGMPSREWFVNDGLHLSPMGYERWTALLMPYLSTFAENGQPAGTVDLGEDLHCVLFECDKGGWIVAAWTAKGEHPLPAELTQVQGYNAAGEPAETSALTPQPTYFKLETLPPAWDAQRQAQWHSPKVMEMFSGGKISAAVSLPKDARMSWGLLPEGVKASAWESGDDGISVSTLEISPQAAIGKYELTAAAEGEGWQRAWKATLNIVAPIQVSSLPFFQDRPAEIMLKANTDHAMEVSLTAPIGQVTPDRLTVTPAGEKAAFSPPADTEAPLSFVVATETDSRWEHWVRPGFITISPAQAIVLDGKLEDWPETARLAAHMMDGSEGYQPETYLAWSEGGLYVAAVIPATKPTSSDPNRWWAESNAEIFIDTSGQPEENWATTTRQFYFLPVNEQDNWRLAAGEYIRESDNGRSVYEDPRCKTAISVDAHGYTLEMFIPAEALGRIPTAGSTWRLMVSLQRKNAEDTTDSAAWPVRKDKTSVLAARYWGTATFGN